MKNTILIGLAALFIIAGSATAKDLLVPSEYKTIQAAIDDANDGDTVIVADGTYTGQGNRDIDFKGKAIIVMSETGPQKCIIDCQSNGRGFTFRKGEDANSVVDGFTITHGNSGIGGGAVFCQVHSSPTITNCIIIANMGGPDGGGIYCMTWCSPTISDCTINGNVANRGAGIYCSSKSSPKITNCTISGNCASQSGGGLYCCSESLPTITNCIITGNVALESGGGLFCRRKSSPKITNCTICDNKAQESGGGIICWDSSPKIKNSILWNNLPTEIFLISGSPVVTYCDIKGGWKGKGKGNIDLNPLFVMDGPYAVTGTWTSENPEAAQCRRTNRATLVDSSANFAPGQLVGELIYANDEEQKGYWQWRQSIITANTTTSVEVIFSVGGFWESGGDKGKKYRLIDYYLQPGSPCIDAGTAEGAPATDIQGRTRDAKPDIGTYETGF